MDGTVPWHAARSRCAEPVADALQGLRSNYLPEGFDHILRLGPNGDDRALLPRILTIRDHHGDLLGAAVVLQDVTPLRLLDEVKSNLVATVSHELKTPLTGVRLAVHLLLEEAAGPLTPKQTELLLDARENSERLLAMVENMLNLARLEQGSRQLDFEPHDPAELLRTAADVVGSRAHDKGIDLVIETSGPLPAVPVDQVRIQTALNNLLDNAIEHTDRGGRVTLRAEALGDSVVLTVTDNGRGIPPEALPHVFEKFFRVPGRSRREGTGLGLAIVHEIVVAHGGTIACTSAPGQGTTFRLTLPDCGRRRLGAPCGHSGGGGTPMMANDKLPPEHFLTMIRQQRRGRLKIYLGFIAGVGKTYEMLQEAHRLKRQGVDVVVGIVETHGRAETAALVDGLEQVPRRKIEYHGITLEEMDLDAILARRPKVCLVDELAHTNAPGSRNSKRYQDVEDLTRAGINVICTLNIQHLESLYDMVEKATGVKVKERVPDYVLGIADQFVNVDVSAEDLRERLLAGKIYPAERIETAMTGFFTAENLTRLREMALEEIAHRLDRRRQDQKEDNSHMGSERLMVCISSRSPNAERILRKAARLADRLNAFWYVVYIQTPHEELDRIDAATQRHITNTLTLTNQLGGTPMTFKGRDIVQTIAAFAAEYGITHIVVGRSMRPWYKRWLGQSFLDRLLQAIPAADVLICGI